jgi:FtsP/CotA-like multicopper oxidase with cupredoxin domain
MMSKTEALSKRDGAFTHVSTKIDQGEKYMERKSQLISLCLGLALVAVLLSTGHPVRAQTLIPGPTGYLIPNYFGNTPNWAYSPLLPKFVDSLPGLCGTPGGTNSMGQCIPVAIPDTTTYPGSDYYEIELVEFREQMHSSFPPVVIPPGSLLGKMDPAATGGTKLRGYRQTNTTDLNLLTPHYLGPLIIAQKDRPVRIKFTNSLPIGAGGNLFIPVDKTVEGAGPGPNTPEPIRSSLQDDVICFTYPEYCYTENRATLHLHGGRTPWVSDGTPHQWITPAGETTAYPEGVSKENVPDMPDPGPGSQTFYWTNQQSARLLFYHDHAWGITRLNVYVGEAAGYLITDSAEQSLIGSGGLLEGLGYGTPLVIQDKTFVDGDPSSPNYIMNTDPTWAWGSEPGKPVATPVTGDLWWPHVYMPAQNPYNPDRTGVNPMGRWVYAPWFFPPPPLCGTSPTAVPPFCLEFGTVANPYNGPDSPSPYMPGTPNPSWGAEAFLDTPVINGTAYPTVTVPAGKVRFRILNAAHDRFFNLQLYQASNIVGSITLVNGGAGYKKVPLVTITNAPGDTTGKGATAQASIDPVTGAVTAITLLTGGSGYTQPPRYDH